MLVLIGIMAFVYELLDSSTGQGYGTLGSPTLILFGFASKLVVPAQLISQVVGDYSSSYSHNKWKNADFSHWKNPDVKRAFVITAAGIAGVVIAAWLGATLIPKDVMTTYIGIIVTAMGLLMISGVTLKFTYKKLITLGAVSAFNKGMCYDDKTEILTMRGWLPFKDLTMDDKVACLSKTHEFYWCKPSALQRYAHKGKMVKITHKTVDLLVTPNHRLYVREQNSKNYALIEASKLDKYAYATLNKASWSGEERGLFYLPKTVYSEQAHNQHVERDTIKMDDWLDFLGWYVSEGSVVHDHEDYIVCLKQLHKAKVIEIKKCLGKLDYKYCFNEQSGGFRIYNKQLHQYLKKLGRSHEKYIPDEFMNLAPRQLKILFESLMKGDGYRGRSSFYYTTSKKLANQVQEIAMKLGYNSSMKTRDRTTETHLLRGSIVQSKSPSYEVNIRKSYETFMVRKQVVSEQDYDGMVYCCTAPEHVILVRRNGYSTWCGNSGGGYGPVVAGGQVIIGVGAKNSIGITDLAEGPICTAGFITWSLLRGISMAELELILPLCIGAFLAPWLGCWITYKIPVDKLKKFMGIIIVILGFLTIAKMLNP